MRILATLAMAVLIYLGLFYMQTYEPEEMKALLLQADIWGFTAEGRQEKDRLSQIKALTIPYEQKKVLIDRKVFIGASNDMVVLALGTPHRIESAKNGDKSITCFVYYFPDEMRPTKFVFERGSLTKAYKSSALEVSAGNHGN